MKYYAGIGSRETPTNILQAMTYIATVLSSVGYILRSGGASGADSAFEAGAGNAKEIYLPWKGFNGNNSVLHNVSKEALQLASTLHPAWNRCSQGAQKLHGRNCYQVLGEQLVSPVEFVVCWTPNGTRSGGTGQALRLAERENIKIYDLALMSNRASLEKYLRQLQEIHNA
jgi:hypothetical protein